MSPEIPEGFSEVCGIKCVQRVFSFDQHKKFRGKNSCFRILCLGRVLKNSFKKISLYLEDYNLKFPIPTLFLQSLKNKCVSIDVYSRQLLCLLLEDLFASRQERISLNFAFYIQLFEYFFANHNKQVFSEVLLLIFH